MGLRSELAAEYGGIPLCGGKGTRLSEITGDSIPKPLVEVGGRTLIQHTTDIMVPSLTPQLVFAVGHRAEQVQQWVQAANLRENPFNVGFSTQTEPGVVHAVLNGANMLRNDHGVIANTDEVRSGLSLHDALAFHESQGRLATLVVTESNNLARERVVIMDEENRAVSTEKHPERFKNHPERTGLVSAGVVVFHKDALKHADPTRDRDWNGIFDPLVEEGQLSVYVADNMRFFNVGTPPEYYEAVAYLESIKEEVAS